MRRLLVVLALAFAPLAVIGATTPAQACSCVSGAAADYLTWSDVAFVGTITGLRPTEVDTYGPELNYEVAVQQVYQARAQVPAEVIVSTASIGAACGLGNLERGKRYLIFAREQVTGRDEKPTYEANLCGGTVLAPSALVGQVERLTGPPSDPSGTPATSTTTRTATFVADDADDADAGGHLPVVSIGIGAGGVLLAGGAAWWLRRQRRAAQ